MNRIYLIAYIEAWKIQDFNGVWTRELEIFAFLLYFSEPSPRFVALVMLNSLLLR